jgi:hypothetical protein
MISKRNYLFSLSAIFLLHLFLAADSCNTCTSHEFIPRLVSTDLTYTNPFVFYDRHHHVNDNETGKIIYSSSFFYQRSTKSKDLGAAFLLGARGNSACRSNCITVRQDGTGDVSSYWLGLTNADPADPFASTFCISPERISLGYYGYFYFDLSDWVEGLWIDASSAIVNARHKLNYCENGNTASAIPGISTVYQALNNPAYQFGKFNGDTCEIDKYRTGVDDVQLRLGYERSLCDDAFIGGLYAIGTIPTGDAMNALYVFQPTVGSRHGSIGLGIEGDYTLWTNSCDDQSVAFLFDANYRYALQRWERRTFDLCANGPFSRFLLVARESDPATALPGVNFFTQKVEVTPRSTVQAWLALHYQRCNYDVELGYDFFWRQDEKLCPQDSCSDNCRTCFDNTIGIYQLGCPGQNCTSASTATIAQGPDQIVPDATFVTLTAQNLNIASGAAGKALSNKIYAAIAMNRHRSAHSDWFAAFGGSYEFVSNKYACTTLPGWAVFIRFGFIF